VVATSGIPAARAIAGATAAVTLALCAAALFQDAFIPVLVSEYWWGLIGLTAAAHRMALPRPTPAAPVEASLV
jgi:hypothetical protein